MSELAERERIVKRGWAAPGGFHDRFIRFLKIAMPALIGVTLAFLAFAPLEEKQEVSFVLDKTKVDQAEERMRVQSAQYRGQDDQGRPFVLSARSALQESSADPVVQIRDMNAQIRLNSGPARLEALAARYNMDSDQVDVVGPIQLTAADGYTLETSNVRIDLRSQQLASRGSVQGKMPLGRFTAGRLEADLEQRTVVLGDRARLHIEQGVIR